MAGARPRAGDRLRWPVLVGLAVVAGLAIVLFFCAEVPSYLTDAPEACINCHVMQPQYAAWQAGPHSNAAACNDCHTPADPLPKLATKARSGLAHAWAFTTGRFPDVIRIGPHSLAIARASCIVCHASQAESMAHGGVSAEERDCTFCHFEVGHAD